jgi:hypothetical protein
METKTLTLEQQDQIKSLYNLAVQRHAEGKSEI